MHRVSAFAPRTVYLAVALGLVACQLPGPDDGGDGGDDKDEDLPIPAVTDLRPTTVTWGAADGPPTREHGAAFVSADGARAFVFGGSGYPQTPDNVFNDAWQLDITTSTWSPWPVSGDVPPAGAWRGVRVSDTTALLWGAYLADFAPAGDAFALDLETGAFTRLAQVNAPPARSLHVLAYDQSQGLLMTFGGFGTDVLGDTWVGTVDIDAGLVSWSEVAGPGPSARYGSFAGVDEAADTVVLFSGAQVARGADPINAAQDVWSFSFVDRAWRVRTFRGAPPNGRRNGCGVFDPVTRALLVFGGTADGRTTEPGTTFLTVGRDAEAELSWVDVDDAGGPPLRSSGFGAPLPGGGVTCGFGNDNTDFRDFTFWRPVTL